MMMVSYYRIRYLITWSEAGGGSDGSHSQLVEELF